MPWMKVLVELVLSWWILFVCGTVSGGWIGEFWRTSFARISVSGGWIGWLETVGFSFATPEFARRSMNDLLDRYVEVVINNHSSSVFMSTAIRMIYEVGMNWHFRNMGNSSLAIPLISFVSSNCAGDFLTNERSPSSNLSWMNCLAWGFALSFLNMTSIQWFCLPIMWSKCMSSERLFLSK